MSLAVAQFLRHLPARFGQAQPYRVVPRCRLVVVADEALVETVHGLIDRLPRGEPPRDVRRRHARLAGAWVSLVLAVRRVVSQWYHAGMGMTLRTSEKQTEALRRQALAEGRSMQAVALSAIDEYIERRAHQTEVNAVLDKVIERERGVLRRLADT